MKSRYLPAFCQFPLHVLTQDSLHVLELVETVGADFYFRYMHFLRVRQLEIEASPSVSPLPNGLVDDGGTCQSLRAMVEMVRGPHRKNQKLLFQLGLFGICFSIFRTNELSDVFTEAQKERADAILTSMVDLLTALLEGCVSFVSPSRV